MPQFTTYDRQELIDQVQKLGSATRRLQTYAESFRFNWADAFLWREEANKAEALGIDPSTVGIEEAELERAIEWIENSFYFYGVRWPLLAWKGTVGFPTLKAADAFCVSEMIGKIAWKVELVTNSDRVVKTFSVYSH